MVRKFVWFLERSSATFSDLRERGELVAPRDDLAADDGGEPVVAVDGVEMVAESREVQGDLVGDRGRVDAVQGGVEVPAGPVLDRVGGGETADR